MCFSEKNLYWHRAETSVAGVWNFVAINQLSLTFLFSNFSKRVYVYRKDIALKTCQSCHCNITEALSEAPYGVGGTPIDPVWKEHILEALWEDLVVTLSALCWSSHDWSSLSADLIAEIVFCENQRVFCLCREGNRRCCFLSYLRKKKEGSPF